MKAAIYIHVPFCVKKCMYCDFYSVHNRNDEIERFICSLLKEIESTDETLLQNWDFISIYFGGGTPSILEPKYIDRILNKLSGKFALSNVIEISLEANPGEAPLSRLKNYRKSGINRLSLGIQSFHSELLKFLTRIHSVEDCYSIIRNAQSAGFENISIDLINNIPGQSKKMWKEDLKTAIELNPNHISAYSLTVEKGTVLHQKIKEGSINMPTEKVDVDMFNITHETLDRNGYPAYEISNFAPTGYECVHNLGYWKLQPYLGFGPSAHSYDVTRRYWNTPSLDDYIESVETDISPVCGEEILSLNDKFNELVFNGLRMKNGVLIDELIRAFSGNFQEYLNKKLKKWKYLQVDGSHIKLSKNGMIFADEISSDLFLID